MASSTWYLNVVEQELHQHGSVDNDAAAPADYIDHVVHPKGTTEQSIKDGGHDTFMHDVEINRRAGSRGNIGELRTPHGMDNPDAELDYSGSSAISCRA